MPSVRTQRGAKSVFEVAVVIVVVIGVYNVSISFFITSMYIPSPGAKLSN